MNKGKTILRRSDNTIGVIVDVAPNCQFGLTKKVLWVNSKDAEWCEERELVKVETKLSN